MDIMPEDPFPFTEQTSLGCMWVHGSDIPIPDGYTHPVDHPVLGRAVFYHIIIPDQNFRFVPHYEQHTYDQFYIGMERYRVPVIIQRLFCPAADHIHFWGKIHSLTLSPLMALVQGHNVATVVQMVEAKLAVNDVLS